MVFQLLYESRAITPRGQIEDLDILREALERNAQLGVTGYLVRSPSHFAQLLEGEEGVVWELYAQIRRDKRHSDVKTLMTQNGPNRQFPDWSMGYAEIAMDPNESVSPQQWLRIIKTAAQDLGGGSPLSAPDP
ncbi:MAG: blue light sensor protein [Rhodobacterales bacterium]|nr:MAG: blue light sensor protein [Rhodobacterales bacterium]